MSFNTCSRPRNAAATRLAILEAANRRFAAESYEQVGMRDIAGDVGVDPALISRYFGSKEELFLAVLDCCDDCNEMIAGTRSEFGERMAHDLVFGSKNEDDIQWLMILLRSMTSAKASEIVRASAHEQFHKPLVDWIGGPDAAVRAQLLSSILMGVTVGRDLTGGFKLNPEECERFRSRLAQLLQDTIDG